MPFTPRATRTVRKWRARLKRILCPALAHFALLHCAQLQSGRSGAKSGRFLHAVQLGELSLTRSLNKSSSDSLTEPMAAPSSQAPRGTSISRRQFFAITAQAASKSCLALSLPAILAACGQAEEARSTNAALRVLTGEEFVTLDAMTARIIPTDSTPGAREAGVVYFIDHVLADDRESELQMLRTGLADFATQLNSSYGVSEFAALSESDQDAALTEIETGQLFGLLRYLTLAGMFALPEYGGTGPQAGYEMIGFENRHAWVPPFGAYDAADNSGGQ